MPRETRLSQLSQSQKNYAESIYTDEEKNKRLKEAASKLVLYALHNLDNKKILRQAAIQKFVAVKGVNFNKQLIAANSRLLSIYGCELVRIEDISVKMTSYYIKKKTPHINITEDNVDAMRKKIFIFLIMTIIFMSNGKCSTNQLLQLFQKLNIDEDNEDGIVEELLKELSSNKMVEVDNDVVLWGPMAEVLIDKMEILEFVSKVYGTRPNSWGKLYNLAEEQNQENALDDEDANVEDCLMTQAGPSQNAQRSSHS